MPVASARLSYTDCFTLFERAYEDPKGARYQAGDGSYGQNKYFSMRMHQARAIDRQDNKELFPPGDPLYGRSIYDALIVQLKEDAEGKWWVYVSHTEINQSEIESLSELEAGAPDGH